MQKHSHTTTNLTKLDRPLPVEHGKPAAYSVFSSPDPSLLPSVAGVLVLSSELELVSDSALSLELSWPLIATAISSTKS